jgi:MFS family permease
VGLGSQVSLVAYPLLVLATTGSAAKAGVVGFARNLPIAALALPAGALVDRVNRKHLMVWSNAVRTLALAAIPIALAAGSLPYAVIVAVALVDGSGVRVLLRRRTGSAAPARPARATRRTRGSVRDRRDLLRGLDDWHAADQIRLSGIARRLRSRQDHRRAELDLEQAFLRVSSLLFTGSNPIFVGLDLLVIVLAKRHGASSALIGETWVLALSLPLLLLAHNALLLGLIVAAAELITPVTNSIVVTYRVALTPDRLQGRVQAASTLVSFSAGWLGPLVVGLLLQSTGPAVTILMLAGWATVLAVGATASRAFRHPPDLGEAAAAAA